MHNTIQKK